MPQYSQSGFYPPQTTPTTSFQPRSGEPKFLDQVADACRVKHVAYRTEQAYVGWVKRFILFHNKRHPSEMGASEVRAFLTHLACNRRVAASTQNQALWRHRVHVSRSAAPRSRGVRRVPKGKATEAAAVRVDVR